MILLQQIDIIFKLCMALFAEKVKVEILAQSKKVLIISMGQKLLENSKMGLTEYPTELWDHLLVEVLHS